MTAKEHTKIIKYCQKLELEVLFVGKEFSKISNKAFKEKHGLLRQAVMARKDPGLRVTLRLRKRLWDAVTGQNSVKGESFIDLVGCTQGELVQHIESQFTDGMTWGNYGRDGWHVDHIRPCSSFDLTDLDQQRRCFHYTNLQPLWAVDNLRKNDKWDPEVDAAYQNQTTQNNKTTHL